MTFSCDGRLWAAEPVAGALPEAGGGAGGAPGPFHQETGWRCTLETDQIGGLDFFSISSLSFFSISAKRLFFFPAFSA